MEKFLEKKILRMKIIQIPIFNCRKTIFVIKRILEKQINPTRSLIIPQGFYHQQVIKFYSNFIKIKKNFQKKKKKKVLNLIVDYFDTVEQYSKFLTLNKKIYEIIKPKMEKRMIKGIKNSFCEIKEIEILKKFLEESKTMNEKSKMELIYKATQNGFGPNHFHRNCDRKENLLVLIKANNFVFGGFSTEMWDCRECFVKSEHTFIFSLSNPQNRPSTFKCIKPEYSIFDHPFYGEKKKKKLNKIKINKNKIKIK